MPKPPAICGHTWPHLWQMPNIELGKHALECFEIYLALNISCCYRLLVESSLVVYVCVVSRRAPSILFDPPS